MTVKSYLEWWEWITVLPNFVFWFWTFWLQLGQNGIFNHYAYTVPVDHRRNTLINQFLLSFTITASLTVHLADVLTLLTDDRRVDSILAPNGPYVSALYGRLRVRVWVYRRVVQ